MAKKNARKGDYREKEQKEFEEEVLQIDRVTRVVKGGRRLRFRATVAIGDKKGRVGVGVGKSSEVVGGIQKAISRAKANLINVPITKGDTIPHAVRIKYKAAEMIILPASPGTGVIAGGSLRKILHLAGVKNVLSKNIGTRNTLVTAKAAIKALQELRPVRESQRKKEAPKKDVSLDKNDNKGEAKKKDTTDKATKNDKPAKTDTPKNSNDSASKATKNDATDKATKTSTKND